MSEAKEPKPGIVSEAQGTVTPVVVVHGGAGTAAPELHEAAQAGVQRAAQAAQRVLVDGGSAQEAVVVAVRLLEDDATFNAGRGSCMNIDGDVEVDAALMRSIDLRSGAIGGVRNLRDGILVAQAVLEQTRHCLLVGEAAEVFAKQAGVGSFGRDEVWTQKAQSRYEGAKAGRESKDNRADTVGAVAIDRHGHLCAGGSTGGVLLKTPGRVGDTPMVGAGLYAHPKLGTAAATGVGEAIMTHVMAYEALRQGQSAAPGEFEACAKTLCEEIRRSSRAAVGLIALSASGEVAVAHASRHMSWAVARGDSEVEFGLTRP